MLVLKAHAGDAERLVERDAVYHGVGVDAPPGLAAAVAEMISNYDLLMPGSPSPGADLDTWLRETAVTLHDLNARLMWRAFWDMNVERPGISPVERDRRRVGYEAQIARYAWHAAAGAGRPPSWVVDAFALQLSGFATNCLASYNAEKAGRVSARVLSAVLATARAEELGRVSD